MPDARRSTESGLSILPSTAPGLPFAVELVEPTGSETQVQGKLGDQPIAGVFRERIDARPGQTIRVRPQPGAIHLFDARSTQRLY